MEIHSFGQEHTESRKTENLIFSHVFIPGVGRIDSRTNGNHTHHHHEYDGQFPLDFTEP